MGPTAPSKRRTRTSPSGTDTLPPAGRAVNAEGWIEGWDACLGVQDVQMWAPMDGIVYVAYALKDVSVTWTDGKGRSGPLVQSKAEMHEMFDASCTRDHAQS